MAVKEDSDAVLSKAKEWQKKMLRMTK